jgi:hypothetical protein
MDNIQKKFSHDDIVFCMTLNYASSFPPSRWFYISYAHIQFRCMLVSFSYIQFVVCVMTLDQV